MTSPSVKEVGMPSPSLYLHVRLLRVYKLLDDFSEAICIREVPSRRPGRWVLALRGCFHGAGARAVEAPAELGDLFSALRDNKKGEVRLRTRLPSIGCPPHREHQVFPSAPSTLSRSLTKRQVWDTWLYPPQAALTRT